VEARDDLAKLLHHVIALDKQMRRQPVTTDQAGVSGQEDAALAIGLAEKGVVLTGRILDIIP
jgi:hypothetical protein